MGAGPTARSPPSGLIRPPQSRRLPSQTQTPKPTPESPPWPPTVPQPPRTLISVVTEFVASVLHPLLSAAEGSPIQIPILSAVLSLVRNEFERILAPQTVNVASQRRGRHEL